MPIYFITFIISCLVTLIATPIVKNIALKKNITDNPSDALKVHSQPIPYLGGIAIYSGIIAALLYSLFKYDIGARLTASIFIGISLIMFLGLADDVYDIKQDYKFITQIIIAIIFISFGIRINTFPLIYISIPFSIFYILGACNSLNLLDGLDGLAAGNTAISAFFFSLMFAIKEDQIGLILSMALLGACIAFLFFNFQPAKIFMGDAGSMLLGFLLAILMLRYSSTPYNFKEFVCPILICGVPIFDTGLTYLRRYLNNKPIFPGDRSHFYDQLIDKGLSTKGTVLISYLLGILLGIIALIIYFIPIIYSLIILVFLSLSIIVVVAKMKMLKM